MIDYKSLFHTGWRPAIGWVLVIALFLFYAPQYAIASIVWVSLYWSNGFAEPIPYPVDARGLIELTVTILGMAVVRTIDKKINKPGEP